MLLLRYALLASLAAGLIAPPRSAFRTHQLRAEAETGVSDDARAALERLALKTSSRDVDEYKRRTSSGTALRRRAEERKLIEVLGRTDDPQQFGAAIECASA